MDIESSLEEVDEALELLRELPCPGWWTTSAPCLDTAVLATLLDVISGTMLILGHSFLRHFSVNWNNAKIRSHP